MNPDVSPEVEPIVYIVDDDASVRKSLMRLMASAKLKARHPMSRSVCLAVHHKKGYFAPAYSIQYISNCHK